jgi:hypothetical protein
VDDGVTAAHRAGDRLLVGHVSRDDFEPAGQVTAEDALSFLGAAYE